MIGVLTLTPYDFWRRTHAVHHSTSGNLRSSRDRRHRHADRAGVSRAVRRWVGCATASTDIPLSCSASGPAYLFILQHRLPVGLMRSGWQPWLSTMATNLAIAAIVATMIWLIGIGPFLLVHLPIMLLAASVGVWLFYVQHQFENTVWAHDDAWNLQEVALHGSSHYALPGILRWFTANIGVHHIHHLCSRIPCYRLPLVLRDHPSLEGIGRLTLLQSFSCVRLVLWDEGQQRLVSFRDAPPELPINLKAARRGSSGWRVARKRSDYKTEGATSDLRSPDRGPRARPRLLCRRSSRRTIPDERQSCG